MIGVKVTKQELRDSLATLVAEVVKLAKNEGPMWQGAEGKRIIEQANQAATLLTKEL